MFLVPVNRRGVLAQDVVRANRAFERFFDHVLDPLLGQEEAVSQPAQTPALDVVESDKAYTVTLDLPGVAKENVKIAIDGKRVTLEASTQNVQEKKDGERVIYRERSATNYSRTFSLPLDLDQGGSNAKLEHGVLTLTLAKKVLNQPSQLTVN